MKKFYGAPIMEITKYTNSDIITVSGALIGKGGMNASLENSNGGINVLSLNN